MKKRLLYFICLLFSSAVFAQDEPAAEEKKGFKKEDLFTGGSISLSFFNNSFLVGTNPVFGYSITKWADVGLIANFNYASQSDYDFVGGAKLRQYTYGGGVFTRLFPVRFLFAQAQIEHNIIKQKKIPPNNANPSTIQVSGNSILVGGGYTTGRNPGSGFFYLSVLFDVSDNEYSPYKNEHNRPIPIIRGGIHIPLFQGTKNID